MIKNDWGYSVFIGALTVVLPSITLPSFAFLGLMESEYDAYTIPGFILSILLPFWIGISMRKVNSYKKGFLLGLVASLTAGTLAIIPMLISDRILNPEVKRWNFLLAITMGSFFFIGLTICSTITPLFRKKYWGKLNEPIVNQDILDR